MIFRINFSNDYVAQGLLLSYVFNLMGLTIHFVLNFADVFNCSTKIQRLQEYDSKDIQFEDQGVNQDPKNGNKASRGDQQSGPSLQNWPESGTIKIKNLNLKYRKNLPFALKDLSLDIRDGEKVGVVGRTGSGKSTLMLALMRILDLKNEEIGNSGTIVIDSEDISGMGVGRLRRGLNIISQESFLMEGNLRFNVDPYGVHKDTEIIEILTRLNFRQTLTQDYANHANELSNSAKNTKKAGEGEFELKTLKSPLLQEFAGDCLSEIYQRRQALKEIKIENQGRNLSLGQRQLICIARVLIKKPKILLMDESTASLDEKTTILLQGLLDGYLQQSTVIMIAHQLLTVAGCDRVIVLKNGRIVEQGAPGRLLMKSDGYFSRMARSKGAQFFEKMVERAQTPGGHRE